MKRAWAGVVTAVCTAAMLVGGWTGMPEGVAEAWAGGEGGFAGSMEYMEGIDALMAGDFGGAAEAFGRAGKADDENADFFAARGAALVLGERYEEAKKSLARALRLKPGHHGATVWQGVITRVGGEEFEVSGQEYLLDRDGYEAQLYWLSMDMAEPARRRRDIERAGGDWPDAPQPDAADARAKVAAAKAKLPEVAKKYGAFLRSDPRLGGMVFEVAKGQCAKGEWWKAMAGLKTMEEQKPDDPEVLFYLAECSLGVGDADAARRYYTRVLTHKTGDVQSYLGRAKAKALLGDGAGSGKDVEVARGIDGGKAEEFLAKERKGMEEAIAGVPQGDLMVQWEALREAAAKGEKNKVLVDAATGLARAMNAKRKRYDESYQEGLRVREAAVAARHDDADAAAELADYLYREVDVRGSGAEERAPVMNWRWQTEESKELELRKAEGMADRALQVNPNQVTALAVKAAVRMRHLQWADGETLLKKAMGIDPTNGKVLMLFGEVLQHVAAVKRQQAWNLRSTESWEDSQYIYTRYPSQAELAAAEELERQSRELWRWASQHVKQAAEARKGTAEGYYWEGFHAYTYERVGDAVAPLMKATQLEPGNVTYAELLAEVYERNGQNKEGIEERFRALNILQTTDSTLIRLAWECVKTDRWRSAREFLDRAKAIDPADPRICAYYALCAEGEEDMAQANGMRRMALALDEAKARLQGNTLRPAGKEAEGRADGPWSRPVYAMQIGLTGTTRNRLGKALLDAQDWKGAANVYDDNLAMEGRIPESEWQRGVEVFTGIPSDRTTVARIMGTASYGCAVALHRMGKEEAAADMWTKASRYAEHEQPAKETMTLGYEVYTALVKKGGAALAAAHFDDGAVMMFQREDHLAENKRILEEGDAKQEAFQKKVEAHQKKIEEVDKEIQEVQQKMRGARGAERDQLQREYRRLQKKRQELMEEFQEIMQEREF